jgi:hypothetical protein
VGHTKLSLQESQQRTLVGRTPGAAEYLHISRATASPDLRRLSDNNQRRLSITLTGTAAGAPDQWTKGRPQFQSRHGNQAVLTPINVGRLRISTQRQCCDLMTDKDRDILCCHKAVPRVVSVECAHTPVPSAVWLETTALVLVLQPIECPLSCPELPMYSRDCRFVVNGLYRPGKLALAVSQARERSRLWRAGPRNHDRLL